MIKENKTKLFKKHIQMIVQQVTGAKVSQEKAWELFKAMQLGTVEFVNNIEEVKNAKTLSLAGVGKFQIKETRPTGKRAGQVKVVLENGEVIYEQDESLPVWQTVPRFKFKPSSAIENMIFGMYGCPGYEDLVVKHHGIFSAEVEVEVEEEVHVEAEVEDNEVDDDDEDDVDIDEDLF